MLLAFALAVCCRVPADWVKQEFAASVFIASKVSWLSTDVQTCPDAHLGDGLIDVVTSTDRRTMHVRLGNRWSRREGNH